MPFDQTHLHTDDLEEATAVVGDLFCPHSLTLAHHARRLATTMAIGGAPGWPMVRLRYGAPLSVDARYDNLILVQRCVAGQGRITQDQETAQWRAGSTVIGSADRSTRLEFGGDFAQTTLKLDRHRLEALCARHLGYTLDARLRFALRPFSTGLEYAWSVALDAIDALSLHGAPAIAAPAAAALEEFILTLLLTEQQHNYSDALAGPEDPRPASGLVRATEQLMREQLDQPITMASLAQLQNVSVRTLQSRFQQVHNMSPSAWLRNLRLDRARELICQGSAQDSITDIALRCGFFHAGRFSQYYRRRFRESPVTTWARAKARNLR